MVFQSSQNEKKCGIWCHWVHCQSFSPFDKKREEPKPYLQIKIFIILEPEKEVVAFDLLVWAICVCESAYVFMCIRSFNTIHFHCVYMILNYPKLYKAQNVRKKLVYSFVCEARAYVQLPTMSILYTRYAVLMCGVCVFVALLNTRW